MGFLSIISVGGRRPVIEKEVQGGKLQMFEWKKSSFSGSRSASIFSDFHHQENKFKRWPNNSQKILILRQVKVGSKDSSKETNH